jgi:glycosyltransferase involved in cell wall biosynthesis
MLSSKRDGYDPYPSSRDLSVLPILGVSLIVPVFNEEDSVGLFVQRVNKVLGPEPSIRPEIIFVNDGSTDNTLEQLIELGGFKFEVQHR